MGWLRFLRPSEARERTIAGASGPTGQGEVEVREVLSRRDLDLFLRVPWRTNAGDPNWVPRLLVEVKEFLDPRRHPFYLHGAATKYVAVRGGEAVGCWWKHSIRRRGR